MMMRLKIVLACVIAVGLCAGVAGAADDLGVHVDLTLAEKYMAHGFNINGDHASFQPSLTLDTKVPGLQLTAWSAMPVNREQDEKNEFDYLLKYGHTFFGGEPYAVNVHGYVDYWEYPNTRDAGSVDPATGSPIEDLTGWKFNGGVTLPKLLPLGPACLVPSYNYYFWTPRHSGGFEDGGVHEIFLNYNPPLESFLPVGGKQTLDLSASINNHDGAFGVQPGWSHATAHASTTFVIATLKVTPSVNYQWSFEDTVDNEDEFWTSISVARDF